MIKNRRFYVSLEMFIKPFPKPSSGFPTVSCSARTGDSVNTSITTVQISVNVVLTTIYIADNLVTIWSEIVCANFAMLRDIYSRYIEVLPIVE